MVDQNTKLRLLKVDAIMRKYNCTQEEAMAVRMSGEAPVPKKEVKPRKVDVRKQETKEDDRNKEVN